MDFGFRILDFGFWFGGVFRDIFWMLHNRICTVHADPGRRIPYWKAPPRHFEWSRKDVGGVEIGIFQKAFRWILFKEHRFRAACGMIPHLVLFFRGGRLEVL